MPTPTTTGAPAIPRQRTAPPAPLAGIEHVEWGAFLDGFDWRQGEHVSCIGPTGCGKSTLQNAVLHRRTFVTVIVTKPTGQDVTLSRLVREQGYRKTPTWPPPAARYPDEPRRVLLWPRFVRPEDVATQQRVIHEALGAIFVDGGWCVSADELWYLCHRLKLGPVLEMFWSQGRSLGLSLVGGTQRPAFVPLMAYDQATHLFLFRDNDETNLRRVAGLGGLSARTIRAAVAALPKHHALYVNTRDGELLTTVVPPDWRAP